MKKTANGFTLVEVAVVMVIGGLIMAAFSSYVMNYLTTTRVKTTESRIEQIHNALQTYANTNKRLPCVASRVAALDSATYGREINSNCASAPSGGASGNVRVANAGKQIRIGAIPTRDLNLPDEYGYDAWGSRLVYAVTENQTAATGYDPAAGGIGIVDSTGNSVISPANSATFIVVSSGSDRKGGFTNTGAQTAACTAGTGLDVENCNDNGVFRQTLITSSTAGASFYDDYLAYGGSIAGGSTGPVIQIGEVSDTSGYTNRNIPVTFPKPFSSVPNVQVSLKRVYYHDNCRQDYATFSVSAINITTTGFTATMNGNGTCGGELRVEALTWIAVQQ